MIQKVFLPQLGQTVTDMKIEKWLKKEGDIIEKGDILLEVTTDKATVEVESFYKGILKKIIAFENETLPVLSTIALIGDENDPIPNIENIIKENIGLSQNIEQKETVKEEKTKEKINESSDERIKISPIAKKRAKELNIDINLIKTSNERISIEDVENYYSKQNSSTLSSMRKIIAEKMTKSKTTVPHFYLFTEINMEKVIALRENFLKNSIKISVNDFIIKASSLALKEHSTINSSFSSQKIIYHSEINIGIAIALSEGLIVPVIKNADKKSLEEIGKETKNLIEKAKNKKLLPDEISGGSFSISNLGMFEITSFLPIIQIPEAAILGVGSMKKRPIVINDEIKIAQMINLSLCCDHRVIDGDIGAKFLKRLKEILETANF